MKLLSSLVFKQILQQKRFSLIFILNLCVGFFSLYLVESLKGSISESILNQSKNQVGGDIALTTRTLLSPTDLEAIHAAVPPGTLSSQVKRVFSMVSTSKNSRLVQIKAIDSVFPLYGGIYLKNQGLVGAELKARLKTKPLIWISADVQAQLELKEGDHLQLGQQSFQVDGIIDSVSNTSFSGMAFAPEVYISDAHIESTGLLQLGSTLTERVTFKLPDGASADEWVTKIKTTLKRKDYRIQSHREEGEGAARVLNYISDFLGLVSMVTLCLASLGVIFLLRTFLINKRKELGIFFTLGWNKSHVFIYLTFLILTYAFIASLLSLGIAMVLLPFIQDLMGTLTPYDLKLFLPFHKSVFVLTLGPLFSFLVCLPFLMDLIQAKPSSLFSTFEVSESALTKKQIILKILYWFPAWSSSFLIAFWLAPSYRMTFGFMGLFWCACFLAGGLVFLLLWFFKNKKISGGFEFEFSMKSILRHRFSTTLCFIALSLGALLINLLPQIENSLRDEIQPKDPSRELPSFFLFDVQEEQIEPLESFLKENHLSLQNKSPMVRARLIQVNGKEFETLTPEETENQSDSSFTSREEEESQRFRNRGVQLSFKETLSTSERVVKGEWGGSKDEGALPWASLEERFADRMGLKLGDQLTFDIQGFELTVQVTSFRKVRWTSFSPNFFILIQPGALLEAPKNYIGTLEKLTQEVKNEFQNKLVLAFPNISLVDVESIVKSFLKLSEGALFALYFLAWMTVLVGLIVLYSIGYFQAEVKKKTFSLLKVLGLQPHRLNRVIMFEFLLLGLVSCVSGTVLSFGMIFLLHYFLFEMSWTPLFLWPLFVVVFFGLFSYWIGARVGAQVNQYPVRKMLLEE